MQVLPRSVLNHHHPFQEFKQDNNNKGNNKDASDSDSDSVFDCEDDTCLRSLALLLEHSLRLAKKAHLSCGEVLLPPTLLMRVARDALRMGETEPCGLRGALVILHFQGQEMDSVPIEIGRFKPDPGQVPTFQLHLTLKEEQAPWYSRLPQLIMRTWSKDFTKPTLIISPGYILAKRKLYRSPTPPLH